MFQNIFLLFKLKIQVQTNLQAKRFSKIAKIILLHTSLFFQRQKIFQVAPLKAFRSSQKVIIGITV